MLLMPSKWSIWKLQEKHFLPPVSLQCQTLPAEFDTADNKGKIFKEPGSVFAEKQWRVNLELRGNKLVTGIPN